MKIEVFPVTVRGAATAARIKAAFKDALVHRPEDLKDGRMKGLVRSAMKGPGALLFIGAAGIAIRAVAPFLRGKDVDPAVVVMDERARFVISLISGHLGGANPLANDLARILGATPVITTATDIHGLPCVEDVAKAFSLAIEDVRGIKAVNAAILDGRKVYVVDEDAKRLGAIKGFLRKKGTFDFRRTLPSRPVPDGVFVHITPFVRAAVPAGPKAATLMLRPREFVFGTGCMKGVSVKEIEAAFNAALDAAGISPLSIRGIATIDVKRGERGLDAFAVKRGLKIEFFNKDALNTVRPPSGPSKAALAATGAAGVAECAAMLSAGVKKIWLKKIKSGRVTAAIARARFTS